MKNNIIPVRISAYDSFSWNFVDIPDAPLSIKVRINDVRIMVIGLN